MRGFLPGGQDSGGHFVVAIQQGPSWTSPGAFPAHVRQGFTVCVSHMVFLLVPCGQLPGSSLQCLGFGSSWGTLPLCFGLLGGV